MHSLNNYVNGSSAPSREVSLERPIEKSIGLTTRESVELFQEALDTAHEEHQKSLNGSDDVKLRVTVDLRRKYLTQIPKEVIAIINRDVERLNLAHNSIYQIANDFVTCSALRYLNLRDNRFREIPKAVLGLPQLEILEISRNKLTEVPDDIENMKALRVFGIQNNCIEDLPSCLWTISTLRLLKLTGNPLAPHLKRIIESSEQPKDPPEANTYWENERDALITKHLVKHMREHPNIKDSGEDSSDDTPLETPRALSRFPVTPNTSFQATSGSESASDLNSPGFIKPPIPARAHYRVPSSQNHALQKATLRRPGLAPLALGNERNRSNSESILQATQNTRNKRMGIVTKKASDLGVLDETRAYRNSHHLRGQSHGSALLNDMSRDNGSPSYLLDLTVHDRQNVLVRRLASLPEQKQKQYVPNRTFEGIKTVLFSARALLPHFGTLSSVIQIGGHRGSNLDQAVRSITTQLSHIDEELERHSRVKPQDLSSPKAPKKLISQATRDFIHANRDLGSIVLENVQQVAKDTDSRYVRSLAVNIHGALFEVRNAIRILRTKRRAKRAHKSTQQTNVSTIQRVSTITEVSNEGDRSSTSGRSVTPTREDPKPVKHWRNGNTAKHSLHHTTPTTAYGAPTSLRLYTNGRSRSNSRAGTGPSSLASTPRSESFSSMGFPTRSRKSSINTTPEQAFYQKEQAQQFEKIYEVLKQSADQRLLLIPQLESYFVNGPGTVHRYAHHEAVRMLWTTLVSHNRHCIEMSEAMKMRLSTIQLNDPRARNERDFWRLVKSFVDSWTNLMDSFKSAVNANFAPNEMKHGFKPIHLLTKDLMLLITNSPWSRLISEPDAQPHASQPLTPFLPNGYHVHRTRGSGGSAAGGNSSSSPYTPSVPATPLSAALGPAAQATMPATPASASFEKGFHGDVFQRAETLQHTMVYRR